jgi:formylglycine-generating enzyme
MYVFVPAPTSEFIMQSLYRTRLILSLAGVVALAACGDDNNTTTTMTSFGGTETSDGGDGDPTGTEPGDGDPTGTEPGGDGDPSGDGDAAGDGDADGDGDGNDDPTGDGSQCVSTCGTPNCGACPSGPTRVDLDGYAIDSTEVTAGQYAQFLAIDYAVSALPPGCEFKTDFTPDEWPFNPPQNIPAVGVDWCDAWAFCTWAGKRLCGAIGGGPAELSDVQNPAKNEWYRACAGGGVSNYPYGLNYDGKACNTVDAGFEQLITVGTLPTCEGGYDGVFDMSGNAWEWTNACNDATNQCRRRGGSFYSDGLTSRCGIDSLRERDFRSLNHGFRCCADL